MKYTQNIVRKLTNDDNADSYVNITNNFVVLAVTNKLNRMQRNLFNFKMQQHYFVSGVHSVRSKAGD